MTCEVNRDGDIVFLSGDKVQATIQETITDSQATLKLIGLFSNDLALDLSDEMTALLLAHLQIVVDVQDVTYMSASVAEVLLRMEQRIERENPNQTLKIIHVQRELYERFRKIGLHQSLDLEVIA